MDTHRFTYQLNAIKEKLWRFIFISFQSRANSKFYILDLRMKKYLTFEYQFFDVTLAYLVRMRDQSIRIASHIV